MGQTRPKVEQMGCRKTAQHHIWVLGRDGNIRTALAGKTRRAPPFPVQQGAFTDQWFVDQLNRTIADAGPRYTPEVNVTLPVSKAFDGLYRHTRFFEDLAGYHREINKYARFSPTEADAFAADENAILNREATKLLQVLDVIARLKLPSLFQRNHRIAESNHLRRRQRSIRPRDQSRC